MASNNPFHSNNYDLGVGNAYGFDKDSATENLLRTAYTNTTKCYVCNYNTPQYQVLAKKDKHITAEIQNGLYLCGHCIQLQPVDPKIYSIKPLA
jgi:hypothetical protein